MKQQRKQKKTSDVNEKMTPYQKTKQTPFIVSFITILGGFLWILKKNKQNASNFIVKNRPIDNLFMGKNTKKQGKLTLKSIENGLKSTKKTSSLLFYKKMWNHNVFYYIFCETKRGQFSMEKGLIFTNKILDGGKTKNYFS